MYLLKLQLEFFGLKAPAFSWVVSAILVAYAFYVFGSHAAMSKKRQSMLSGVQKLLIQILGKEVATPHQGLSQRAYQAMSAIFGEFPLLTEPWRKITSTAVMRQDKKGENRIWICDEIHLDVETVMDHHSYKTAPTVISGIGLLATFLAILVALLDVKLANNKVQGLDLLVQGLSGKFLSSVVAIACATLLVYGEKWLSQPIKAAVTSLRGTLQEMLPRLSSVHIMAELSKQIDDHLQTTKSFSSDVAIQIRQGIDESLRPTMDLLTSTITNLGEVMSKTREQDSDAMRKQLTSVFTDFGQSINSSLNHVGDRMESVLGGSSQHEFAHMSNSLSEMTALLQEMNSRLSNSWGEMTDLINLTKATTTESSESYHKQIEHLTGIVSDLMDQLQERTEGSMERTLSALASDMSGKVMDLSAQLTEVLEKTSERTSDRVKGILDEAGSLTSKSVEYMASLFERHSTELGKVENLKALLDGTLREFVLTINRYGEVSDGLRKITVQVNAGIASLAQVAQSIRETQEATTRSSKAMADQFVSINDFADRQHGTWDRIEASMIEYEKVFSHVEEHARDLLIQIGTHLHGYSNTTQSHFVELASTADKFLSRATERISGSVDELSEQLDELHGTLVNMDRGIRAVR
jgi:methyl-accepting chemotaxis protein